MRPLLYLSFALLLSTQPLWLVAQHIEGDVLALAHTAHDLDGEVASTGILSMPFPNPATDQASLRYEIQSAYSQANLRVFDMLGKQVATHSLHAPIGHVNIAVRNLKNGIYFCALEADGKTLATRKLVVSR